MASWESSERSRFSLSDVRDRMREKKKGPLRTAKLNASLASKIKTKIINNSSTIKVSLKHNNKALALALNAEKANVQRLTQEKTILHQEVEQCHFQNAMLRHKLSFLNNILKEFENLVATVKTAQLSEFHTSSASLSNGQKSSTSEDTWDDYVSDGQLVRTAGMPMRVPISKPCDAVQQQQGVSSVAVQTYSLYLQKPASKDSQETVPVSSKDTLPPQSAEEHQTHQEENRKEKPNEAIEAQEALLDSQHFGEALCDTQENPNNFPACACENYPLSYKGDGIVEQMSDRLSQGHVTQRKKHSSLFATSTPSSGVAIFPNVSSTQAAQWSITNDSSSPSKSNTQTQLKSPSYLVSPTQATVALDRKSLGKEILCDQPQAECDVEMDPSCSPVPEFVPVEVKSKGNRKTGEKTTVKKRSTGIKKINAIKNNAEGSLLMPRGEETAQNAKKLLQPEVVACSSASEVSEVKQKACVGAFNRKNRGFGVEQHSLDEVRDLRTSYMVAPAQQHSLGSGDLVKQDKKEIQSMESFSKSPVHTFSSHAVSSEDSSLQDSLFLRKEIPSTCALQEDSDVSKTSSRQKTKRKTRVIRQRDYSDEENLPNVVKIPEAKAEEPPKRSTTNRKATRKSSCSAQKKQVDVFGPCVDVQGVAKESTKDSLGNLKRSRKTYVVCPLVLAGNLDCAQTNFERGEIVPLGSIPGSKASKIPRTQRLVAAQSNTKQTGGPPEEGQTKVDNTNASRTAAYPRPKPQRKRNASTPLESVSPVRNINGAKVLIGSSAEVTPKQTVLRGNSSCIPDLLSEPHAFVKEQIAEVSLRSVLMDLSLSLEFSSPTCSAASPVDLKLTDVSVSKTLSTESSRMPEKSSVSAESSLMFKEKTAEEIPEERNQVESSSGSYPSQEPAIKPLQDVTNTRTHSPSSSEVSGRSSRRRRGPTCYAEPKLNSKLRRGDPFTDTEFLHSPLHKTKKNAAKAQKKLRKIKKQKEWFPEGCSMIISLPTLALGRDTEQEGK